MNRPFRFHRADVTPVLEVVLAHRQRDAQSYWVSEMVERGRLYITDHEVEYYNRDGNGQPCEYTANLLDTLVYVGDTILTMTVDEVDALFKERT